MQEKLEKLFFQKSETIYVQYLLFFAYFTAYGEDLVSMIFLLISCRLVKNSCMTNKIFVIFGRKKCSNFSCLDHDFLYILIKMGTNCFKNICIKIPKFYCIVILYQIKNKYILTLVINLWFVMSLKMISVLKLKQKKMSLL